MKYSKLPKYSEEILSDPNELRDVYANFYYGVALAEYKTLSSHVGDEVRIFYCKGGHTDRLSAKLLQVNHFLGLQTSAGFVPFLEKHSNTFITKVLDKSGNALYDKSADLSENTLLANDFSGYLTRTFGTVNPDKYSVIELESLLSQQETPDHSLAL